MFTQLKLKETVARAAVPALLTAAVFMASCGSSNDNSDTAPPVPPPNITTLALFAGNVGGTGTIDGIGATARFASPEALSIDDAGNVFIVDTYNYTIRKLATSGSVTTMAGTPGVSGSADGTGAGALFYRPGGIAVAPDGTVYVADTDNHTIRKLTATGSVTTLAGQPLAFGSTDGSGDQARFASPRGLAVDRAGNLYVADSANATIRKVTPAGSVSTVAGAAGQSGSADGTGPAARFASPRGIAVDTSDNLYVADTGNSTIRKITPSGEVTTVAGAPEQPGSADGVGSAARFMYPRSVTADRSGTLYVADTENQTIRRIAADGTVSTVSGYAGLSGSLDGPAASARFYVPFGIAADSTGNILVADTGNNAIRRMASGTGAVSTVAGSANDFGSVDAAGADARFAIPYGLATDSAGYIYVGDASNHTIRRISPAGAVATLAGSPANPGNADGTSAGARFFYPRGVTVDSAGNVYVADEYNNTIRKISSAGIVTTLAGMSGPGGAGSSDGTGTDARFSGPLGVAVDRAGSIFVADSGNHVVRRISPAGAVTTVAGVAGIRGSVDGAGAVARFSYPRGIAVDAGGNVYVADTGNSTIRRIAPTGQVTTVAGSPGEEGTADGVGAAARFSVPYAVAADDRGNVYVADTGNATVRRIDASGSVTTVVGVPRRYGFVPGTLPGVIFRASGLAAHGNTLYITIYNAVVVVTNLP